QRGRRVKEGMGGRARTLPTLTRYPRSARPTRQRRKGGARPHPANFDAIPALSTANASKKERGGVRASGGGDEGEEAGAGAVDLVAEQALEQSAAERAAVVQVHGQAAAVARRGDLGLEHPGRVVAAIALTALEADQAVGH